MKLQNFKIDRYHKLSILLGLWCFFCTSETLRSETKFAFQLAGERQVVGNWVAYIQKDVLQDKTSVIALIGGKTEISSYGAATISIASQASLQLECRDGKYSLLALLPESPEQKLTYHQKYYLAIRKDSDKPSIVEIPIAKSSVEDAKIVIPLWHNLNLDDPIWEFISGKKFVVSLTGADLNRVAAIYEKPEFSDLKILLRNMCS